MERKIKYICRAIRWFDMINGNTYHSAKITRCKDGAVLLVPFQYDYDDHYRQSSLTAMAKAKWLPVKYRKNNDWCMYERENKYPIVWSISEGLKRECIANGKTEK